ncbi:ATP-binding protein [Paenibacillus sp. GCM10028914]|uniref:HAMP domain-containing sensor histidine kinase n=1 Tax=Paenibacillus sp. GCM10028914 TaxID=3273416 RepID=UPI00360D861D
MKMKRIIVIMCIILAGGVLLSWQLMNRTEWGGAGVDIIAVNETVKEIEASWDDLDQASFRDLKLPFVVLSLDEQVLFSSSEGGATTVNDAIRNRDTVVDIKQGSTIVGKLIIPNDGRRVAEESGRWIFTVALLIYITIALLCVLYLVYVNRTVIRPFRKLQHFAQQVARGQLETPLEMNRNNWFGAFSESFDIMRVELAAARQSEYEANRSKKELVASLSHDIKTPLSSIKAVSELMLVLAEDGKQQKQLRMIHSKAEQIDLLVTDMFHTTLEELDELKVSVNEVYSTVLSDMIQNVNHYDKIHCGIIPDVMLLTDVRRLQQVFDNVISNAYKYADTELHIQFRLSEAGDFLVMSIMDFGDGVPTDELPLLFNKFQRGSNSEGLGGSGLGLYISKYLMERMQGDISCHNREDGFTVKLQIRLV